MKNRRNRASWKELEDEIEPIVYTTAQEWGDIRMAYMTNCSNLCEKLLLFSLISGSFCQPFHSNSLTIFQGSSVHLCIPSFSNQIIWHPNEKTEESTPKSDKNNWKKQTNQIFYEMGSKPELNPLVAWKISS